MIVLPELAGPHDPLAGTPPRRAGSRRRTTSIDSRRPAGLDGAVEVDARARDLVTGSGPVPHVAGSQRVTATVEGSSRRLLAISADPPEPRLVELVGVPVASGFRAAAAAALGDHVEGRNLLHALVDDLPGALLVSGYAVQRGGRTRGSAEQTAPFIRAATDQCAGWAEDATIVVAFGRHGEVPMPLGPLAPVLERPDDDWSWHTMRPLGAHGMRRRRRLDVSPGAGCWDVEAHFRDSHVDGDGTETVVHEYLVEGRTDQAGARIDALRADARVLPWLECPAAVGSAARLVGGPVSDLRARVRADFVGVSTCTHLNDTLRSLADIGPLLGTR